MWAAFELMQTNGMLVFIQTYFCFTAQQHRMCCYANALPLEELSNMSSGLS